MLAMRLITISPQLFVTRVRGLTAIRRPQSSDWVITPQSDIEIVMRRIVGRLKLFEQSA